MPVFKQAASRGGAEHVVGDERCRTAMELFNAYFYETSLRAKFLTLITILEVLAPVTEKHAAAQKLVGKWKAELQTELTKETDVVVRTALASLDRELDFRKETSIRQRIRLLIREEFPDPSADHREKLEKQAVKAYDARGTLTHTGQLAPAVLDELHQQTRELVRRILARRLGISL